MCAGAGAGFVCEGRTGMGAGVGLGVGEGRVGEGMVAGAGAGVGIGGGGGCDRTKEGKERREWYGHAQSLCNYRI